MNRKAESGSLCYFHNFSSYSKRLSSTHPTYHQKPNPLTVLITRNIFPQKADEINMKVYNEKNKKTENPCLCYTLRTCYRVLLDTTVLSICCYEELLLKIQQVLAFCKKNIPCIDHRCQRKDYIVDAIFVLNISLLLL